MYAIRSYYEMTVLKTVVIRAAFMMSAWLGVQVTVPAGSLYADDGTTVV